MRAGVCLLDDHGSARILVGAGAGTPSESAGVAVGDNNGLDAVALASTSPTGTWGVTARQWQGSTTVRVGSLASIHPLVGYYQEVGGAGCTDYVRVASIQQDRPCLAPIPRVPYLLCDVLVERYVADPQGGPLAQSGAYLFTCASHESADGTQNAPARVHLIAGAHPLVGPDPLDPMLPSKSVGTGSSAGVSQGRTLDSGVSSTHTAAGVTPVVATPVGAISHSTGAYDYQRLGDIYYGRNDHVVRSSTDVAGLAGVEAEGGQTNTVLFARTDRAEAAQVSTSGPVATGAGARVDQSDPVGPEACSQTAAVTANGATESAATPCVAMVPLLPATPPFPTDADGLP